MPPQINITNDLRLRQVFQTKALLMHPNERHLQLVRVNERRSIELTLPDPIAILLEDHGLQFELCDVLERIADGLPDNVDRTMSAAVVAVLRIGMPRHMRFEEEALFPLLRVRAFWEDDLDRALSQLELEHESDESFALEIADELEALAINGQAKNAEMLGYMLRGFFDSQRRHIEWENTIVIPLARRVLTHDDLHALRERLLDDTPSRHAHGSLHGLHEIIERAGGHGERRNTI